MQNLGKKTICYLAGLLAACTLTVSAQAASLSGLMTINPGILDPESGLYVDGSFFAMNANYNPNASAAMLEPGTAGGILLGTYQNFVLDPDTPHLQGWMGDTNGDGIPEGAPGTGYGATPVTESTIAAPFSFFGTPTYLGSNPLSYQSAETHAAPTASVDDAGILTVDLSSWEVMWNGSAFQQGPRPVNTGDFVLATGTYDAATHAYTLKWKSQIKGGPFNGVPATWYLEGTINPVPVPSAVWLLGSGLAGLLGIRRQKRS